MIVYICFLTLCCFYSANAFLPGIQSKLIQTNGNAFSMQLKGRAVTNNEDRKESFLQAMKKPLHKFVAFSASLFLFIGSPPAFASSLEDANTKLSGYSLPPVLFVPSGFSPLVSEFGRGNAKEPMTNPILVQFNYPSNWIVQKTSVNNNGEAGTIAANDYIKGDSAFLFTGKIPDTGNKELSSSEIKSFLLKSVSQKGDVVDSFKILRVSPGATAAGNSDQPYIIVDFSYQLNTEAGFIIERQAVASLTTAGGADKEKQRYLQGIVAATTGKRFRQSGLESKLREIATSFRATRLNSGIFSATD